MILLILFTIGLLGLTYHAFLKDETQAKVKTRISFKPRPKPKSPLIGICVMCHEKITLPFKCTYCGGLYCLQHHLPESHMCDGLNRP